MTSPDERREIAERVRHANGIFAFVSALGIDVDSDWYWKDVSRRVADLIDPTCHAVHSATSADDELVCSECGATLGVEIHGRQTFVSNFCPCCGRRVVSQDETR